MAGFDPGHVGLRFGLYDDRVIDAELRCERPNLARILCGQPADQAVALVPLVYSLCGRAQGIAARAALAAARGQAIESRVDTEAWAEAAREHAWKLFIDWPRQLALAPDETFFVRLMRSVQEVRGELAAELAAHPLPAALCAAAGHGDIAMLFKARMEARLGELRDWLQAHPGKLGAVSADCVAIKQGLARVETARGPLVHRLSLDDDRIAGYEIIAPTDIHFAAGGDVARWLGSLKGLATDEAKRQALLLVLAFDPCVPWEFA